MIEINNTTKERIDLNLIEAVIKNFLEKYKKKKHSVSIAFVSNRAIKEINKKYRNKDKVTDVLSFEGENEFLGEIIISYSQIKKQAKEFNKTPQEELIFILIHGLLHLLGYKDDTEEGRQNMIQLGEKIIEEIVGKK